tara:strand:- start:1354 stop:1593 length:240 start_codon:yes stop_codon:yes gene_type:complete
MTDEQIKQLFMQVVTNNDLIKPLGASKDQLYNWRHPKRKKTSLGVMLEVLGKLGYLKFQNVVITTTDIHPVINDQTRTP